MPLDLYEYGVTRGGGAAPKALYGIGGLGGSAFLITTNPSGTPGDPAGFYIAFLMRLTDTSGSDYTLSCEGVGTGWAFIFTAGGLSFRASDGGGVLTPTPDAPIDANKVIAVVGVWDGSELILYVAGQPVTSVAMTGYTPRTAAMLFGAGFTNGRETFFAGSYGTGIPNDTQIAAWYASCKASRYMQEIPGFTADRMWRCDATGDAPVDSAAGVAMVKVGAGFTTVIDYAPAWQ